MGMIPFRGKREEEVGRGPTIIEQETLDSLWAEAESIGRIEVDKVMGGNAYKVTIRFNRKSGSMVWAAGEDVDIRRAIEAAIREAELLRR